MALLKAQYGKHLSSAQLELIAKRVKSGVARAVALKKVPLTNADEPGLSFRADLP